MAKASLKFSVGLEIHARLKTRHKIFCGCLNQYGDAPNTNICPVCCGLPGSLPVLNQEIIPKALRAAAAFQCNVPRISEFSRKNYFYPDLPRNFQITQYHRPLALKGYLEAGGVNVNLTRIHLEEDAGRSIKSGTDGTLIDLNRAGAPLIEIVTEPDFENGAQARGWLTRLRQILRYLDICDGDMETGSLRCDANVGFHQDSPWPGAWVELKNLNSFKWVGQAVDYEIERLKDVIARGEKLTKQTRSWDSANRQTKLLRLKEESAEYRFFPEPDLPLLVVELQNFANIVNELPELPAAREKRFTLSFGISPDNAIILCRTRSLADYFETCVEALTSGTRINLIEAGPQVAVWVLSLVLAAVGGKDEKLSELLLNPYKLAQILVLLVEKNIYRTEARILIQKVLEADDSFDFSILIQSIGKGKSNGEISLEQVADEVLAMHPQEVEKFKQGKKGLMNFFVGQIISRCGGCFDAQEVQDVILKKIN